MLLRMQITPQVEYTPEEGLMILSFMGHLQALPTPSTTIFLQQAYFAGITSSA